MVLAPDMPLEVVLIVGTSFAEYEDCSFGGVA